MNIIKTELESQPLAETLDSEKAIIAQKNGDISLVYLNSSKLLSLRLDQEPVQVELYQSNIYVLTKPFRKEVSDDSEESEEILANNLLAAKKTGVTLWKIAIHENSLEIETKREKTGGFVIHDDKLYACNVLAYGFYILNPDLEEVEKIEVKIKVDGRTPWYSSIKIIDDTLFLIQEENQIRWFKLGDTIEEMGIIVPEFPHMTSFISINSGPKQLFKVDQQIVGTVSSGNPYVITLRKNESIVAIDPKKMFSLKYKELFSIINKLQAKTDRYALAMDKYRIVVTDSKLKETVYAFSFTEPNETLYLTRISVFENYVICFAWTNQGKYPVIIFDMTEPEKPTIINVINCGKKTGEIKIEEDI
ncbi:hypothetical protein [Aquimarina megaterium]|uniref:hypothetical protein n=1 Tax=Aquimarina megaterium TaxID=1443666 RepID=UPI00047230FE|nr:hypothetical protein [Aquimarina megaterium]